MRLGDEALFPSQVDTATVVLVLGMLTPGDAGVLQAVLDDCAGMGDDATVDDMAVAIEYLGFAIGPMAKHVAYYIVHMQCRKVVMR